MIRVSIRVSIHQMKAKVVTYFIRVPFPMHERTCRSLCVGWRIKRLIKWQIKRKHWLRLWTLLAVRTDTTFYMVKQIHSLELLGHHLSNYFLYMTNICSLQLTKIMKHGSIHSLVICMFVYINLFF